MASPPIVNGGLKTRILPVTCTDLGSFNDRKTLETWVLPENLAGLESIQEAAEYLKTNSIPVAFPTETVYGLGADATRSDAVKGIYKAKGRPSDNPLIIHICDLTMLRSLLSPPPQDSSSSAASKISHIPEIYTPLIAAFWPGPLTILLPNPHPSKLAKEVTAGLQTFGARMPSSPLALTLIRFAGVPLAAPSANASTRPSCTTAGHVFSDLSGRIELILDGGACDVGVESTVVDGTCSPPVVLRPGGISIDLIRQCEGWHDVTKGYRDNSEVGSKEAPRAPGMKYQHYSPKAKVVLFEEEASVQETYRDEIILIAIAKIGDIKVGNKVVGESPPKIGVISTATWDVGHKESSVDGKIMSFGVSSKNKDKDTLGNEMDTDADAHNSLFTMTKFELCTDNKKQHLADIYRIPLGAQIKDIAHGLFSALRDLDEQGCEVIYVEGIKDEGDIAAAVMNRLRKAATVIRK